LSEKKSISYFKPIQKAGQVFDLFTASAYDNLMKGKVL